MAGRKRAGKRRKGWGGIYVLLTVVLTLAAIIVGLGLFFRVASIEVKGASAYKPDEIISSSGIVSGDNMLMLDAAAAEERISSKLVYVESAAVEKAYPNKIIINITEAAPAAVVGSGAAKWLIDSGCKVLEQASGGEQVCQLTGVEIEEAKEGSVLVLAGGSTQLKYIQELLGAFEDNDITGRVDDVDVSNIGSITFSFDGRLQVGLGSEGEIANKVAMLIGAVGKLDANAKGRLEFTTDVELHYIPEN